MTAMIARRTVSVIALSVVIPLAPALAAGPIVRVTNYADGETVRFPTPLLAGELSDADLKSVTVTNASSNRATRQMEGLAHKGKFKVLTELVPGKNTLRLRAGPAARSLTLVYKPQTNPYVVRVIYFTDKTGETAFQTPIAKDPQDWRGKLDTAMKLMQAFTAERMNDLGFGRRTFNLELDEAGRVKVHLLKGPKTAAQYHRLNGSQLYGEVGRELRRQLPHRQARNLVIPAFTRFDPRIGRPLAHTALGGGNLALFGGGDLFTWPDSLADVQKAFSNAALVDPKKFFSDSVGRHAFWANASTTMGAALHEVGHMFGLPHSRDAQDIMTRGHDRLNRFFTLIEPPHAHRPTPYEFKASEIAYWAPVSAGALAPNRYFALDDRAWRSEKATTVKFDGDGKRVVIESDYGIRYVGVWRRGPHGTNSVYCVPIPVGAERKRIELPMADVQKRIGKADVTLCVLDGEGLRTGLKLDLQPTGQLAPPD